MSASITQKPVQHRKADTVNVPHPRYGSAYIMEVNANEAAIEMARKCHGVLDWRGVMSVEAPSGLSRLANAWLRANHPDKNARIGEYAYSDGTSRYSPYWEQPKRKRTRKTA